MDKKLNIIITTFNDIKIERALLSLINQTYKNWHCTVISDGSWPKYNLWLKELIAQLKDDRIQFLEFDRIGRSAALNAGLKESINFELIAILDSDDEFLSTKLEKQIKLFDNPKITVCFTGYNLIYKNSIKKKLKNIYKEFYKVLFLRGFSFCHSSVMFRNKKEFYYNESITNSVDFEYFSRFVRIGKITYINEILVNRYVSDNNFFIKNITKKEYRNVKNKIIINNWLRLFLKPWEYVN